MTHTRRMFAGVATAFILIGLGQVPSHADDSGNVVAGTFTVNVKAGPSNLPSSFKSKPGNRTYYFGTGCTSGTACQISRVTQEGETVAQGLKPSGNGFSWHYAGPIDCVDTASGVVSTRHGADYTITARLVPSATSVRDGTTYVTAMRGTMDSMLKVNGKGQADGCTIKPQNTLVEKQHDVLSAAFVPLALPPASGSDSTKPLGLDPATTTSSGSLPAFELPQTDRQRASALAVADGRRSSVPGALAVPADAVKNIGSRLGKDLLLVALLGLLMVFPAQLFNSTYEENHERIDRTLGRLRRRRTPHSADAIPLQRSDSDAARDDPVAEEPAAEEQHVLEPVPAAAPRRSTRLSVFLGCALVGTLLGGLLDPKFSPGTASYALLVGVFVAVLVAVLVTALSGRTFRSATHRQHDWYLRAIPSALVVAVLCVLVSRLAHFEPGYLYGVLGGAVFAVGLERRSEGRAETVVFLASLTLAFGAWLAFGPVANAANGADPSFGTLTADALLGSLFIGGVEGLMFGMIPLRFLPGYRVRRWSWIAWGVLTAAVLFTFVHVLLLPEAGYLGRSTVASVNLTLGLFGAFAAASGLFWAWFRLRPDASAAQSPPDPAEQPADAASIELPVGPGPAVAMAGPAGEAFAPMDMPDTSGEVRP